MPNPLPHTKPAAYHVRWDFDVTGHSAVDAARTALVTQRDTSSIATVFDVTAHGSHTTERIDLLDPDNAQATILPTTDVDVLLARLKGLESTVAAVRADATRRANEVVPYQDGSTKTYAAYLLDLIAATNTAHGITDADWAAGLGGAGR